MTAGPDDTSLPSAGSRFEQACGSSVLPVLMLAVLRSCGLSCTGRTWSC